MITYTIEKLYHFRCLVCQRWWTIGDWEEIKSDTAFLHCPHCDNAARPEEEKHVL